MSGEMKMGNLKLVAISMIRNEADIVLPFLNQLSELFDNVKIVDVQSTDGTLEAITEFSKVWPHIELFTCRTQERYQSAMMNTLARRAFDEGADWVFFLDADEFVNIEGRGALQAYLRDFPHDVMHLPWINLIPSLYGTFETFDAQQSFFWSGRVASHRKIALSVRYANFHPEFCVSEGNHTVSSRWKMQGAESIYVEKEHIGLSLLHLPVRSGERLKYKMLNAQRLLESKHNSADGEGYHTKQILNYIVDGGALPHKLNALSASYGENGDIDKSLDPLELEWPTKVLPAYLFSPRTGMPVGAGLVETLKRDAALEWITPNFVRGSAIMAKLEGDEICYYPQPMHGDGTPYRDRYAALLDDHRDIAKNFNIELLIECLAASFLPVDVLRPSAWSRLVPVLFALFPLLKPRRFVELGVHNGMSFFSACQVAERLGTDTQCIAVDSWVGDAHASFHTAEVFETFKSTMAERHPNQQYIQSLFSHALQKFDDCSIDLLHIDGFHTYEAVKDDFETWLPKMSKSGVILFHDINVYERGFGVWRFWEELQAKYPAFSFFHSSGLGLLYVGSDQNIIKELFELIDKNADYQKLLQAYFELMGEKSLELRTAHDKIHAQFVAQNKSDEQLAKLTFDSDVFEKELTDTRNNLQSTQEELQSVSHRLNIAERELNIAHTGLRTCYHQMLTRWRSEFGRAAARPWRGRGTIQAISKSGLFDAAYYLDKNPDVRSSGKDPLKHFVRFGAAELRNPNTDFNTAEYLLRYPDVYDAKINPFLHFVTHGKREGRH